MGDEITLSNDTGSAAPCWCGSGEYEIFSEPYIRCLACGTIHLRHGMPLEVSEVGADETGMYGKQYWFDYQTNAVGLPEIVTRSRADLPERDLNCLRTLMKYKLPGAKVLEIGCAHGGFVALARQAGYDAVGLELSPAIVEYAQRTFDVPVLCGSIEHHAIDPASLDAIAAMDVIEHFPDPVATLKTYTELLKPDGILLIQTPCLHRTDLSYAQLVEAEDRFPLQLKPREHAFLFNKKSIEEFLRRLGFEHVHFEPQLFDYDMFFASSREPIRSIDPEELVKSLLATPSGRIVLAMCDLEDRRQREYEQLQDSEKDRAARLEALIGADEIIKALQKRAEDAESTAAERLDALNRASDIIQALQSAADRRG